MSDQINALFEFVAAFMILDHVRHGRRDGVSGISLLATSFFTLWGVWNLVYYPSLNQWYSFAAGVLVMIANCVWIHTIIVRKK